MAYTEGYSLGPGTTFFALSVGFERGMCVFCVFFFLFLLFVEIETVDNRRRHSDCWDKPVMGTTGWLVMTAWLLTTCIVLYVIVFSYPLSHCSTCKRSRWNECGSGGGGTFISPTVRGCTDVMSNSLKGKGASSDIALPLLLVCWWATPQWQLGFTNFPCKCPHFLGSKSKSDLLIYDWIDNIWLWGQQIA